MDRQLPGSMVNALRVLAAIVLVSGTTALLTWVQSDQVILSWSEGNSSAQDILAEGGIDALRGSPIVPSFVPLAVVSFVVFAALAAVLAAFLIAGQGWARLVLSATVVFGVLVAAVGLRNSLPTMFTALSVLTVVLSAALLFFLWHRETTAYLRDV
jgi:hypothetical protein